MSQLPGPRCEELAPEGGPQAPGLAPGLLQAGLRPGMSPGLRAAALPPRGLSEAPRSAPGAGERQTLTRGSWWAAD